MQTTPNFGLTIYEPNDVTAYLTSEGWNGTMEKIDSSMKEIEDMAAKNATDIAGLETQVSADHDEINETTGELSDLTTTVQGNTANIAGLSNRVTQAETDINNMKTELSAVTVADYQGILSAGEITLAVAIGDYDDNTIFDIYISQYGLAAENVEVRPASGGQPNLVVLTFADAQENDVKVDIGVRNANVKGV